MSAADSDVLCSGLRLAVNQHYKSHGWVLFLSGFQYVLILVCGWLYYFTAGEKNIPSLCIFLPPMIYFLIGLFSQWVRNDFRIILPAGHRNPPMASSVLSSHQCQQYHWICALC